MFKIPYSLKTINASQTNLNYIFMKNNYFPKQKNLIKIQK